jgi:hypothetical protein
MPFRITTLLYKGAENSQGGSRIRDYAYLNLDVLVEFCWIDINVNYARLSCILRQLSSYAIIESHSNSDDYVSFVR